MSFSYSHTESLLSFIGNSTSSLGALATAAYEMMINSSVVDTMSLTVVDEPIDEYYLKRVSGYYNSKIECEE